MTKQDLGLALRKMCEKEPNNQPTMVRLFGIKYASEIEKSSATYKELIQISGCRGKSYQAEIGKGKQLADYVVLKENCK